MKRKRGSDSMVRGGQGSTGQHHLTQVHFLNSKPKSRQGKQLNKVSTLKTEDPSSLSQGEKKEAKCGGVHL